MLYKNTKAKIIMSAAVLIGGNITLFLRKKGIIPKKKTYSEQFNSQTVELEDSFTTVKNLTKNKNEITVSEFPDNPNNAGFSSSSISFR